MRKCKSTLRCPDINDTGTLSSPKERVPVQMGRAMVRSPVRRDGCQDLLRARVFAAFFAAADCPSFFNALLVAFERVEEALWWPCEASLSCAAFFRVDLLADLPGFTSTPSRLALD